MNSKPNYIKWHENFWRNHGRFTNRNNDERTENKNIGLHGDIIVSIFFSGDEDCAAPQI
ncbi:MAG: hypothetical protein KDD31_01185 [Muricauda sp.]|jgi:hypothetical protein|nr:hypothetical protein [Allomuricauda sp.]